MKELIAIQSRLAVPKDKVNLFGKFNYRTAEGILKAVKPLLAELDCVITLSDEIVEMEHPYSNQNPQTQNQSHRTYIRATATLTNSEGKSISTTAYAREGLTKVGMDEAQITGAASSYARKYALCGLLAIDDSRNDPDAHSHQPQSTTNNAANTSNELSQAIAEVNAATNKETLLAVHNNHPALHKEKQFMDSLANKRKELGL